MAIAICFEFSIKILTDVLSFSGFINPRSIAKGAIPASMLPQFWVEDTT